MNFIEHLSLSILEPIHFLIYEYGISRLFVARAAHKVRAANNKNTTPKATRQYTKLLGCLIIWYCYSNKHDKILFLLLSG